MFNELDENTPAPQTQTPPVEATPAPAPAAAPAPTPAPAETLDTKTTEEREVLLGKFADTVRTLPGYGATVVKGKRNFLKIISPSGGVYNVKVG